MHHPLPGFDLGGFPNLLYATYDTGMRPFFHTVWDRFLSPAEMRLGFIHWKESASSTRGPLGSRLTAVH